MIKNVTFWFEELSFCLTVTIAFLGKIIGRVCTKSNTETAKYAKACVEAARESGCCSVDMYTEMVKEKVNNPLHALYVVIHWV